MTIRVPFGQLTRHPLITLALCALAAALAIATFETVVRIHDAYGDAAPIDAGPVSHGPLDAGPALDAGPTVDAGAPAKLDPASLPDPIKEPAAALSELDRARKNGTAWIPILLALIMAGKAYTRRMEPGPGEEPAAGWRAKSIAVVGSAVVVLAAVVDKLAGVGAWTAVIVAAGFGLFAVIDAFNPPKGAKSAG